jgi:hypothetical protein
MKNNGMRAFVMTACGAAILAASAISTVQAEAPSPPDGRQVVSLESTDGLKLVNVKAEAVTYKGKKGIYVTGNRPPAAPGGQRGQGGRGGGMPQRVEALAIIESTDFKNGTIEFEVSGAPSKTAGANSRGFVGIAFKVKPGEHYAYECFYLRPTNGRADDQLRRNHTIQYTSHPDFPWMKLRSETPGVYESYTDLAPGEWTKVKIEVDGEKAKLYVKGADQPCLIINDLKMGADAHGPVALWLESSTDAHFRNMVITNK